MASIESGKMMKKGPWSWEEDQKLVAYIHRYGIWNWNHMADPAGLSRSGKSCRLRWMNYLRPNIRHGNFTQEEEEIIIKLQKTHGNKWSLISSKLEGRTDNEVKNYWNTRLRKRFVDDPFTQQITQNSNSSSVCDDEGRKSESMNSSTLTTSEMTWVDFAAEIRGNWDDEPLYPTVSVVGNDFESMLMRRSISPYSLQESLALDQDFINDNLWGN